MLPTHNNTATTTTTSEHAAPTIKNYAIKSSDVIDRQSRITVEDDEGVLWYKTRELTEHEIVDSLTDAKTNQTRWTIHQPAKKGWYLRLRSPLFPPGACIALTPPQPHQGSQSQAASANQHAGGGDGGDGGAGEPILVFGCQTLVPSPSTNTTIPTSDHSYPPSRTSTSSQSQQPPAYSVTSQQTVDITLHEERSTTPPASTSPPKPHPPPSTQRPAAPRPRWHVTHYTIQTGVPTMGVLAGTHHHPHLVHPSTHVHQQHQQPSSLFHRAFAPLAHLAGGGSTGSIHHFTIQPALEPQVGPSSSTSPDPSTTSSTNTISSTTESSTLGHGHGPSPSPASPAPFIAFTDNTPLLRATPSGTLSVDVERVRTLGVEMAFWVTVGLAFWEFLREREGYLAASED